MTVWYLDLQLPMQPVHIITDLVSSNLDQGEVYNIMWQSLSLRQVGGFLRVLRFPPPINWPRRYKWNIVESGVKHHQTNNNNIIF